MKSTDRRPLPFLHGVTSDAILERPDWMREAESFAQVTGERGALQLRAPRMRAARLLEIALALRPVTDATGCWLVINDRADVALACGADALQLTARSLLPEDARAVLPSTPLGSSVHDHAEAAAAEEGGASWLVAGHVFATASHPGEPGRGMEFLRRVARRTTLPVIAIGGVLPEHVALLEAAGAYGVAAIRGLWHAEHAGRAAFDYLSAHDESRSRPGIDAHRERREPPPRT